VYRDGLVQTISLANPGIAGHRFQNLSLTNVNGSVVLASDIAVMGAFATDAADMVLAGNRVLVNGDFGVQGASGRLVMQNAADTLDVSGSVDFSGGSHTGALTEGFLRVIGDFSASGSATAFVGSGNHEVTFVGNGTQTVTLDNPGLTGQRFADLTSLNFSGVVAFSSTAVVTDTLEVDDVSVSRTAAGAAAGAVLDIRGTAFVGAVTSTGLPIRLVSTIAGPAHVFTDITFLSMNPADIQLDFELPGAGINFPLLLQNVAFDSPNFTTGAYLRTTRGSGVDLFSTQLLNPFPTGVTPPGYILGLNTLIDWP